MQVELPQYVRLIPQEMESAMRKAGIHANTLLKVHRMYNAVGIDVSKGKNTVAVLHPGGTVIRKFFDVSHTSHVLHELTDYLGSLDNNTRSVMEYTDRYREPMVKALFKARLFVSVVNPHLIKNFGNNSLRKIKSDNWAELRQYSGMDNTRTQLKTLNSQFSFFMKQKVAAKANLIALMTNTYPGVNKLFDSLVREDRSEKWFDYAYSFWHVDCVLKSGIKAFTERYIAFCKKHHYIFQMDKLKSCSMPQGNWLLFFQRIRPTNC